MTITRMDPLDSPKPKTPAMGQLKEAALACVR